MNAQRALLILLALLLALGGTAPARARGTGDQPELTLFLGFIPNVQFAPIYMALEKGYFAEEAGVNVVLEYGDENIGVERIAAGELDFGVISGEQIILARYGGRPLTYVFEWWQRYPVAVAALAGSGISSVHDLAGRTVGVPGRFGASYVGLSALLAANDMSEADVTLEEIGYNAPAMLCAGRVEAAVVYIANEPVQIRDQCGEVTVLPVAAEADLVANGLVTNERTLAENPDLVRGMVRALSHGLADVLADPDGALRASRRYVESLPTGQSRTATTLAADEAIRVLRAAAAGDGLPPEAAAALAESLSAVVNHDEAIQMQVLLNSMALWDAPRLGETDPASWETTMNALLRAGLLPGPADLSGAYTNDYLPEP